MQSDREYAEGVERHIDRVCDSVDEFMDALDAAAEKCSREAADILDDITSSVATRAEWHDVSKLEQIEKSGYMAGQDPAHAAALKSAEAHHHAHNRHHPEHWPRGLAGMTLVDLLEMYADWEALSAGQGTDMVADIGKYRDVHGMSEELFSTFVATARGKTLSSAVDEGNAKDMNLVDLVTLMARWDVAGGKISDEAVTLGEQRVVMSTQTLAVFRNTIAAWRKGEI